MVTAIYTLIGFIFGTISAVYCLRLGILWAQKLAQKEAAPVNLPIIPVTKPPPSEPEPAQENKTLEKWFLGGEEE